MTADTLAGKIALVTGGSRGIGRAIALSLAQAGASIAINYRHREDEAVRVREEVMRCGRRCLLVQANVADAREVAQMIETIEKDLGAIDILVNNAGVAQTRAIEELSEKDWDDTLAVNLKSVFLVTQAVLPGMRSRRWGRIINMSSVAVHLGGIIGPHYTASKAGVEGLTRAYAVRLAREGITVNAVAPALIETDMIAGHQQAKADRVPVGRRGAPEEVAMVVTMLASNGFMTGQIIGVNGGMSMG
jgi:3-oxoacyl-[acyl-carrier protein] reductase